MEVTREMIRKWLDNLDLGAIDLDSEFYVRLEGRTGEHDEDSDWITPCYDIITIRGTATCQLFCGYIGTGKSTSLRELKQRLERDNYFVLIADAADFHDLSTVMTPAQFLVLLGAAFSDAVERLEGLGFLLQEPYFVRFKRFMQL